MKKHLIKTVAERDQLIAGLKVEKDLQEFVKKYSFATPYKVTIRKKLAGTYTDDIIDKYLPLRQRQKAEKPTVTYSSIRKDILILAGTVTPEQKEYIEGKVSEIEVYIKGIAKEAALRAKIAEAEEAASKAEKYKKALADLLKTAPAPKKEQKKK